LSGSSNASNAITGISVVLSSNWRYLKNAKLQFIVSSIGSLNLSKMLILKPVVFLGQISYSVYLFHTVVLLSAIHLLYGYLSLWSICLISLIIMFMISAMSYRYIEIPSINIGRRFAGDTIQKI